MALQYVKFCPSLDEAFPAQNIFVLCTVCSVLWRKVAGNPFAAVVKNIVLFFKIKIMERCLCPCLF